MTMNPGNDFTDSIIIFILGKEKSPLFVNRIRGCDSAHCSGRVCYWIPVIVWCSNEAVYIGFLLLLKKIRIFKVSRRKAAENAIKFWRVNEQVIKTVMAANRAATAARVAAIKAVLSQMDGKSCDTNN